MPDRQQKTRRIRAIRRVCELVILLGIFVLQRDRFLVSDPIRRAAD